MATPRSSPIPLSPLDQSSNSVPFPSPRSDQIPTIPDSASNSSNLTSSDKLTALPTQSSPALARLRTPTRAAHRSLETSASLHSVDSSSSGHHPFHHPFSSLTRTSESEGSPGKETPRQRVSFDSNDRISLPASLQGIRQAVAARITHADSGQGSPDINSSPYLTRSPRKDLAGLTSPPNGGISTPISRSPSQSRAASPLRLFGWPLHRMHSREEPFVPVDPFQLRLRWFSPAPRTRPLDPESEQSSTYCSTPLTPCLSLSHLHCADGRSRWDSFWRSVRTTISDTIPRQLYLAILLRLPALYFSRVARVFEDAEVSRQEIQRMIDACAPVEGAAAAGMSTPAVDAAGLGGRAGGAGRRAGPAVLPFPEEWNPPNVSPALARFKMSWELFVDSLLREWKTLNLVSALLCTAILTMFQIPDAAGDPLTRWAALLSLICAVMSLTYGCVYIVQFGTMRSMYKASRWAEEAQRSNTAIWWNIWVLLATPAVWLAWSMISFLVSIFSFVWRTGAAADPTDGTRPQLSAGAALAVRITVSVIFLLGLCYFALIMHTFGRYAQFGAARGEWRGGRRVDREREREREQRSATEERERGRRWETKTRSERVPGSVSVMGLGLSGLAEGGSSSVADVVVEEVDLEKGGGMEEKRRERGMGRISPRL